MDSASEIHDPDLKLPERPRLKLAAELRLSGAPQLCSGSLLDEALRPEKEVNSGEGTLLDEAEFRPGMPRWRERQRLLPVAQKVELIGRFILETRQLERVKKACKRSAMF
jgi:hypothetical protein